MKVFFYEGAALTSLLGWGEEDSRNQKVFDELIKPNMLSWTQNDGFNLLLETHKSNEDYVILQDLLYVSTIIDACT